MEFRLTFPVDTLEDKISYHHKILLVGSCFAENIGALMANAKLNTCINPNGIVYNPISIAQQLKRVLEGEPYTENELFYFNELWSSWQHHGSYSSTEKTKTLNQINKEFTVAKDFLLNGDRLIVTLGSAYVYKLKSTGETVANCHKYSNGEFTKELPTVNEIVSCWQPLITQLKAVNPRLTIVFTVSPVRYVRDGLVNNTLSKAILLQAVHQLCNNDGTTYFPAYELVIDDLRDYRFFTEDLVHPNMQAVQYVWQNFVAVGFDAEAKAIYSKVQPLVAAANHKILNSGTEAHEKFVAAHQKKLRQLKADYPFLDLDSLATSFS